MINSLHAIGLVLHTLGDFDAALWYLHRGTCLLQYLQCVRVCVKLGGFARCITRSSASAWWYICCDMNRLVPGFYCACSTTTMLAWCHDSGSSCYPYV
jgi:hypothetical protein